MPHCWVGSRNTRAQWIVFALAHRCGWSSASGPLARERRQGPAGTRSWGTGAPRRPARPLRRNEKYRRVHTRLTPVHHSCIVQFLQPQPVVPSKPKRCFGVYIDGGGTSFKSATRLLRAGSAGFSGLDSFVTGCEVEHEITQIYRNCHTRKHKNARSRLSAHGRTLE